MAAGHVYALLIIVIWLSLFKSSSVNTEVHVPHHNILINNCETQNLLVVKYKSTAQGFFNQSKPEHNRRHVVLASAKTYYRKIQYYTNSVAVYNILLLMAGDVESNPGDKPKCPACQRIIVVNHREVSCSSCNSKYHMKCGGISIKEYKNLYALAGMPKLWMCYSCLTTVLPFWYNYIHRRT